MAIYVNPSENVYPGDNVTISVNCSNIDEGDYYIEIVHDSGILYSSDYFYLNWIVDHKESYTIPDVSGELQFYLVNDQAKRTDAAFITISIHHEAPSIGSFAIRSLYNGEELDYAIQGVTNIRVEATNCSGGSEDISYYVFNHNYKTIRAETSEETASVYFGSPTTYGTLTYDVYLYNVDGEFVYTSDTIKCYQYSSPSFVYFKAYRSDADGTENVDGSYITYDYQVKYSSVEDRNSVTVRIKCNDRTIKTVEGASGSYTTSSTYSNEEAHTLHAIVTDSYGNSARSAVVKIYPSEKILNISSDGKRIGFGGMAPVSNENNDPEYCFYGNVTIDGSLTMASERGTLTIDLNSSGFEVTDADVTHGAYKTGPFVLCVFQLTGNLSTNFDGEIYLTTPYQRSASNPAAIPVTICATGGTTYAIAKWEDSTNLMLDCRFLDIANATITISFCYIAV